jgi:hypothetical protein
MGGLTAERFALLHQGGALADVTHWVHPLEEDTNVALGYGEEYLRHIQQHLSNDVALGVYPLWQRNGVWMVNWCAVDLDDGENSSIHADNLVTLLTQTGIRSWKETSKSKGYHVWVYLTEPVAATVARKGLIGACRVVDVPTREVYPKQVSLAEDALGNCLRLPYPHHRTAGRHEVYDPSNSDSFFSLKEFVSAAWEERTPPGLVRGLLRFYEATEPKAPQYKPGHREDGDFKGNAKNIWEQTEFSDRSEAMYAFASSLLWQEYSADATMDWLRRLDERVGKFVGRPDREKQLQNIVAKASQTTRYNA